MDYRIITTDPGTILTCADRTSGELRIFEWKQELIFEERKVLGEEEHGRRLNRLQAAWQEDREGWELREDLNCYDFVLNEENITRFNQ